MSIDDVFDALRERWIHLWKEEGSLRFRAPAGAVTPDVRAMLEEHREDILSRLPEGREHACIEAPVSEAQLGLWFIHESAPESAAFNVGFAGRLRSEVDARLLESAFGALARRHATLRTTFHQDGGASPYQRVHSCLAPDFQVVDAAGWTDDALERAVRFAYRHPFDLSTGPLLRVRLFRIDEGDHLLLVAAHHIAVDAWSIFQLLDELRTLYGQGEAFDIDGLAPIQSEYVEYVKWQRGALAGPARERHRTYWRDRMAGAPPVLELPLDRPRPRVRSMDGATVAFSIPPDLCARIKGFARDEGVTLYTVLLSAFSVLLHRYSGQEDIVLGTIWSGRTRPEVANTVGCFVNALPLRAHVGRDASFRSIVRQVRDRLLEAADHQDYPFRLITTDLEIPKDPSVPPVFQVDFLLQNPHRFGELAESYSIPGSDPGGMDFGGLALETVRLAQQEGQVDLTMQLVEARAGGLLGSIVYDTDLFDASTVERLGGHYRRLLEGAVGDPDVTASAAPLLTEPEIRVLIDEWASGRTAGGTSDDPGTDREASVVSLFERHVFTTPDSPAVVSGAGRLTYRELDRRANRLARHLRDRGVEPGALVGVQLDRCPEMVIAVLGVWKAGCAYVPMDPTYPRERLDAIRSDSGMRAILTLSDLVDGTGVDGVPVVALDRAVIRADEGDDAPLPVTIGPDALAYVIYTSGTTGRPKGVMVTHRGLAHAYRGWETEYRLLDRPVGHLQMARFSFDVSAGDFVRALCSGGYLVLVEDELLLSPPDLHGLIRRERVGFAEFVPAVFRTLLRYLEESGRSLDCMDMVAVGSDTWTVDEYARAQGLCGPSCRLVNSYGLTEATIDSTWFEGSTAGLGGESTVPIGRPFPGTTTYVLDAHRAPVPVGVTGELYVGGPGVAAGYLNRPELNAERFVPDPFSAKPRARLFRTGDLARYAADGNIHLLGRADHQIKLRGFRIELQEVEAALLRLEGVHEAAAVLREDQPGDRRLVAYWVGDSARFASVLELRRLLAEILPEYMVPSAFVELDALPLSSNGKVDRRALLDQARPSAQQELTYVPPETPTESDVAQVWADALGLDRVGVLHGFFELGGHSLLAVHVVSRLTRRLGVEVSLRDLLVASNVRALAARIDVLRVATRPMERVGEGRETWVF